MRHQLRRLMGTTLALLAIGLAGSLSADDGPGECFYRNNCLPCLPEALGATWCDFNCLEVIGEPDPYTCEPHFSCNPGYGWYKCSGGFDD